MRILRLNKQDTAGIEERQAAERPPPLSGEAGPERAGDRDRLGFVRPCSAGPSYHLYGFRIKGVFQDLLWLKN